ncbi:TetR/AcrR family transcriptional regulator [Gordonia sp. HY002]|uniref:TetR/AcrR family transcriptional regulator n=1 Tax=Gordonia zhenghanii TaxID=2911516 RepID=UPI001EF146BB|nr:helix-turn-helix domain-containing protein [Gordonia zhenghanii]MCF8568849.1 TetR/AcrR family transcriptional regulator [Gordonia zhenghanii]MCF8602281.1 TetR/AcrR family transcriptional regulator [Gordonia zhenghanii]
MVEKTESGLPRPVAIAWGTYVQPQNGPRRGLSHQRIVEQAIAIADAEGIGAVTMARVAKELGFTTMSLYRYVLNKDELLLLMIGSESLLPARAEPDADSGWRSELSAWADLLRGMYRDHLWMLDVPRGPTSVLTPASMYVADWGMHALRELELSAGEQISVILALSSYVASFAGLERDLAGQEDLELGADAIAELGRVATVDRLPYLAPLLLSGGYVGGEPGPSGADDVGVDDDYRLGLDLLLDGLEVRWRRRGLSTD